MSNSANHYLDLLEQKVAVEADAVVGAEEEGTFVFNL
jgi:hypothetical protein